MKLATGLYLTASKIRAFSLLDHFRLPRSPTPVLRPLALDFHHGREVTAGLGKLGRKSCWFLLHCCSQLPFWTITGQGPWASPGVHVCASSHSQDAHHLLFWVFSLQDHFFFLGTLLFWPLFLYESPKHRVFPIRFTCRSMISVLIVALSCVFLVIGGLGTFHYYLVQVL